MIKLLSILAIIFAVTAGIAVMTFEIVNRPQPARFIGPIAAPRFTFQRVDPDSVSAIIYLVHDSVTERDFLVNYHGGICLIPPTPVHP